MIVDDSIVDVSWYVCDIIVDLSVDSDDSLSIAPIFVYLYMHDVVIITPDNIFVTGEGVKRMSISVSDLEDNYLMEKDGEFTLYPKAAGQV